MSTTTSQPSQVSELSAEEVSRLYTDLHNELQSACGKGAFTLLEAATLNENLNYVKDTMNKYMISEEQPSEKINIEELNSRIKNIYVGLDKGCQKGAYTLEMAASTVSAYNKFVQYIQSRVDDLLRQ